MNLGAVLAFDLDGTLLDARGRQVAVLLRACRAMHEPAPDIDRFWAFKREGESTRASLERLGVAAGRAKRLADWWIEHIEDSAGLALDQVLSGAVEALEMCKRRGLTVNVITARAHPEAVLSQIHQLPLRRVIDDVLVVSPAYAASEKALHLARWNAVVMVGDTESDARAATLAGIPFLAVSCGQRSEPYLRAVTPSVFADAQSAVQAWLQAYGEVE